MSPPSHAITMVHHHDGIFFIFCCFALVLLTEGKKEPVLTILGGEDATSNELNFVVSIFVRQRYSNSGSRCSGSIIDERWILTAGHCVDGTSPSTHVMEVYLGTKRAFGGTALRAENWFLHPRFNQARDGQSAARIHNDIALIKLPTSVSRIPNTALVRLPCSFEQGPLEGSTVTIAGFGNEGEGPLALRNRKVLKKADMRVKGVCRTTVPYCIGAVNINGRACSGDSGGPMLYGDKIVGVSSSGTTCVTKDGSDQYTQVSPYINWIQNTMRN